MKKTRINLARAAMMLLLAVFTTVMTNAADVVTVGKAGFGHLLPIGSSDKYVLTQQVYTADEINHAAGKIWSLGFNTVNGDMSRHLSIYVTHTTNNGVWSYTAPTEQDLTFSGDMFFKAEQWNTIDFSKVFEYDGTSNLLITICDDTGTKGNSSALTNRIYNPGSTHLIYATSDDNAFNPLDANEGTNFTSISSWKAQIQLTFDDYPTPSGLAVTDITDVSAQILCSLRGNATAWNLRYRQVDTEEWKALNNLTDRSKELENLTPATQYEVQVQAVFSEEDQSDWTGSETFFTSCCPPEDMCDLLYSMNVENPNSAAFQIVDAVTGIEVANVQFSTSGVSGGYLSLCKGRKYNVNWIKNKSAYYETNSLNFTLFFEPGDEIYTMRTGQAPEQDEPLTSFVMDCGNYCTPMPRFVTPSNITYQSVNLSYKAMTKKEVIEYSTDPEFPEDKTQSIEVTRDEVTDATINYTLNGLESLTHYYIRMHSVCPNEKPDDEEGKSRKTKPMEVITLSKYTLPLRIIAEGLNSSKEGLNWGRLGKEKMSNVNYRQKGTGTPASNPMTIDLDGDGQSFESGSWGKGIYASEAFGKTPVDNVLAIFNVPANALVSWLAAQGITGKNAINMIHGFLKQTKKFGENETDAALAELTNALKEKKAQEEEAQADENYTANLLEKAKKLELMIAVKEAEFGKLDPSSEEAEEKQNEIRLLQIELEGIQSELNLTEDQRKAAEDAKAALAGAGKDDNPNQARMMRAPSRGGEEEYYFFIIRHHAVNDVLLIKDITITPAENTGDWTVIRNVPDVDYELSSLKPGTTYEVMVQPVYESGVVGAAGPITVFTTLGEEAEPLEGVFSVSKDKKVSFAKGNLRYSKDANWNDHWSLAEHQYDILGVDNLESQELNQDGNRFPSEEHLDLFCWSAGKSNKGTIHTYPDDSYYTGDFIEWGTLPEFTSIYGYGWYTLTKDEWNYLLTERENAATLKSFATVADVKGLVLLPDDWDAPDGVVIGEEMTAEQWAAIEKTGAVFLPATGNLTVSSEDYHTIATVNDANVAGSYWSSTPSGDASDINAFAMTFKDPDITPATDIYRRIGSAVRLVKMATAAGDVDGDGDIDEADIMAVVDYILGKTPTKPANADMDGSGDVDIVDLTLMIEKAK